MVFKIYKCSPTICNRFPYGTVHFYVFTWTSPIQFSIQTCLIIIYNNNNNNNVIDLKSKHWTIIKRQNRTKLNTYNTCTKKMLLQLRMVWIISHWRLQYSYGLSPIVHNSGTQCIYKYLNISVYTVIIILHNNEVITSLSDLDW